MEGDQGHIYVEITDEVTKSLGAWIYRYLIHELFNSEI